MSKIIKKIRIIFHNIVMATRSLFWKKDPSVVLIGSWFGLKFADNSRFIFQYLNEKKQELHLSRVVWVTINKDLCRELNDMGYEAYLIGTKESTDIHKIAKFHIICNSCGCYTIYGTNNISQEILPDIDCKYSWRAKRINLWHGSLAMKGVGKTSQDYICYCNDHKLKTKVKEFITENVIYRKLACWFGGWGDCYYVASSQMMLEFLRRSNSWAKNKGILALPPRLIYHPTKYLKSEIDVFEIMKKYKNTILYLPTFRTETSVFNINDVSIEIEKYLEKNNTLLIQKAHSVSTTQVSCKTSDYVISLAKEFDICTILPYISLLITDYSSVFADAIYFRKPILFYVPDLREYSEGSRGLILDPEKTMHGVIITEKNELNAAIEMLLKNEFIPDSKYLAFRHKLFEECGTSNSNMEQLIKIV